MLIFTFSTCSVCVLHCTATNMFSTLLCTLKIVQTNLHANTAHKCVYSVVYCACVSRSCVIASNIAQFLVLCYVLSVAAAFRLYQFQRKQIHTAENLHFLNVLITGALALQQRTVVHVHAYPSTIYLKST